MTKPPLCVTPTTLPGVFVIRPRRFHDRRGFFFESYNKRALSDAGITVIVKATTAAIIKIHTG